MRRPVYSSNGNTTAPPPDAAATEVDAAPAEAAPTPVGAANPRKRHNWIGSILLFAALAGIAAGLARWKRDAIEASARESAAQPEPMETVTVAIAQQREHRRTTAAIGTVLALRS